MQRDNADIAEESLATRAGEAERKLIEAIERSDDSDGNIGKLARNALKRLPSSVYWQGLVVWGIRTFKGSQSQYHRSLDRHYAQTTRHAGRANERDIEHDDLVTPNWHAGLVPAPVNFPAECSLRLTRHEAEYLSERIRLSPASCRSLLAALVARRKRSAWVPFVWQHPFVAELSSNLRELLDNAQNFSEIMHGAALLYNLILSEQAERVEGATRYRKEFQQSAQLVDQQARALN